MTKNATKRALLSSALALVVCISMLIGTTYAWFTDSVTSANNIITSGNLDVELYYMNDETSDWTKVDANTNIFKVNTLWEPGHTEVIKLKVVNEGTLALKYNLGVNIASEVGSTNVFEKAFKLSDYIKYAVIDGEQNYTRDTAVAAAEANNATALKTAYNSGTTELKAKDSTNSGEKIVTMVVYMPTTVGNDANYKKGFAVPTINLGINLFATQVEFENDSFGNDYDEDAIYTDFIVTNEAELVEALANAEEFAVIGIKGNVTWTTGAGIGSTPFVTNAKNITLLGLEDNATFTATGKGVGAIGVDDGTVTFKNLKIADESVSYAENSWEYGYLEFRGNTVFENCEIVNAIMMEGDSATFKNCSFESTKDSEYAVWVSDGVATFENCNFTGTRGIKIHEAYGSKVDTVVINNNTFMDLTKKPGLAIGDVDADTTIVLTNNTFANTQPGDQLNYKYETDTDVTTFNFTDDKNLVATFVDEQTDFSSALSSAKEGDTILVNSGDYKLSSLSGKKGVSIIGAADGSTKLAGVNSFNFGKDTVVKNVTFKSSSNNSVRYGTTSGDVVYENCVFEGKMYGYHVDNANGGTITFNNCTFYGRNALASTGTYTFNDCTFKYTYSNYNTTNIYSEATFNNCKWDSKLELYIESGAKAIIDGEEITQRTVFISDARGLESFQQSVNWQGNTYAGVTVMLSADIDMNDAYYANWTPIGQTGATQFQGTFDGHGYTIKNLNSNMTSQTGKHFSTGLFGWLNKATVKNVTIENATVKGNHNVGVIAGYMETAGCTISNCHVINATVEAYHANDDACGDKVGVIVGHAGNAGVKVENCTAKDSTVVAGRDAGQIVGAAKEANVTGCTAENVTVTAGTGCTDSNAGKNITNDIIGRVL